MELRQPRSFGNEGRKTTHDFLSLYSPPAQQDPRPPPQAGGFLKTHNFLQPLEQDVVAKDEDIIEIKDDEEKPPLNVEHILPGGIGTYSITYFNERFPKPERSVYMMAQATSSTNMNDDNSNCSSYTGSGFTLWDEPAGKKGQTGKENYFAGDRPVLREAGVNGRAGDWPTSLERPTQSSSNHIPSTRSFSSPSSSQPSTAQNLSFLNMLTSAKSVQEEEDDDDEEEEDIIIKKEPSPHPKGPFALKADGRSTDQKPSTPRSKHSATEQRRRSKINDRLQKLREIIPHGDQKRDRASFLLEVIEYIRFLQEKVHKYEGTYPGWNQDGPKLTPWRNPGATEDLVNSAHLMKMAMNPALLLPSKLDGKKFGTSPLHPINGQHLVHEAEFSSPSIFRERVPQPEPVNMVTASIPSSKRPGVFPFGGSNIETIPLSSRPVSEPERTVPQSQFWLRDPLTADCNATDKLKDQELAIESGTINISSIYSQGLFSTLTQALQSSGIDLSQANISVQIDLGKKGRVDSSASAVKDTGMPLNNNQEMPRSSITRTGEDCSAQQAVKRFKSCRS